MEWIIASRADAAGTLAVATDVPLYRAQGAFGVLDEISTQAATARVALTKLPKT